ncbi:MAG: cadherin, partial [Flavobacteriales bacterium]|nr:cadherin [Flavobacteriales bacterium]
MKSLFLIPFLALSLFASAQTPSPLEIDLSLFANGFSSPVGLYHAGDERLFVIEQASGRIKVIDANGNSLGDFLNINSLISTGGER